MAMERGREKNIRSLYWAKNSLLSHFCGCSTVHSI